MSADPLTAFNKVSFVPLEWVEQELPVPFNLLDAVSVDDLTGSLRSEQRDLWREHLSKQEWNHLAAVRIALVHRFFSPEHIGKNEQQSSELLYLTFLALRLVKPTRTRFSSVQYKVLKEGGVDVFSVSHAQNTPINTPEAESLNRVTAEDMGALRKILPSFLTVARSGPDHLQRAIRYYELAYSQIFDPVIQFLTWTTGIEAVVSSPESPVGRSHLLTRIGQLLDGDAWIYEGSALGEFLELPKISVREVLPDIFKLRSRIAHGGRWPDWRPDVCRLTLTNQRIDYAGILREAAPFILRRVILASLATAAKPENF